MIVRIVQMSFKEELVDDFLELFNERKQRIRSFDGCQHLELWQHAHEKGIFFTYSIWDSEKHLDHYRFSELFKDTWTRTKQLFADKPKAWSVIRKDVIEPL
ncbi:MAG: antibiotic biosynthesis monooxygenase [Chitinophagales bacterium]|nr:antibiotic biosynthesis monooxygenase [Chitinophagaceae bacterium]MCB9065541.1 antibiotic biosynthesis monooxygenase [Chitinophagales bacterium]